MEKETKLPGVIHSTGVTCTEGAMLLCVAGAVVELYSEWCGPCKSVLPTFKRIRLEKDDETCLKFLVVRHLQPVRADAAVHSTSKHDVGAVCSCLFQRVCGQLGDARPGGEYQAARTKSWCYLRGHVLQAQRRHGSSASAAQLAAQCDTAHLVQVKAEECSLLDQAVKHRGSSEPVFHLFRVRTPSKGAK